MGVFRTKQVGVRVPSSALKARNIGLFAYKKGQFKTALFYLKTFLISLDIYKLNFYNQRLVYTSPYIVHHYFVPS